MARAGEGARQSESRPIPPWSDAHNNAKHQHIVQRGTEIDVVTHPDDLDERQGDLRVPLLGAPQDQVVERLADLCEGTGSVSTETTACKRSGSLVFWP